MSTPREKTILYTHKLQTQTNLPLWSIADESLIYSIAQNDKINFGKRTKKLHMLMTLFSKLRLSDFLILIIGLMHALKLHLKSRKNTALQYKGLKKIFVGFGGNSENHLYQELCNQSSISPLYVNWNTCAGIKKLKLTELLQVISIIKGNAIGYRKKCKNAIPEISQNQAAYMTVCAKNIGIYAYSYVFWNMLRRNDIEVIFITPEISAFSCCSQNLKTTLIAHGLIGASILMPQFSKLMVLTLEEKKCFRKILQNIEIQQSVHPLKKLSGGVRTGIILSVNTFLDEHIKTIKPFIKFMQENNIKTIIRTTPNASKEQLKILESTFPQCIFDDASMSIYDAIETYQPLFLAAWTSSTLAIAIENQIPAISFVSPDLTHQRWNMIYPLEERILFWPKDNIKINTILKIPQLEPQC